MAEFFIALAGLIHVYIFAMESLLWGKAKTNRVFGLSPEKAEQNRLFAFNQGYYNLFLAVAAFTGVGLSLSNDGHPAGATLMIYSSLSMVGAAMVLLYSQKKLIRPAAIQGVPPLLGLIFIMLR